MNSSMIFAAFSFFTSVLFTPTFGNAQEHKLKTVSPDGQTYAVWFLDGWDETIAIYDKRTGKLKHRITGHGDVVKEFRYSTDSQILAARSRKGWRIWKVSSGKQIMMLRFPNTKQQSKNAEVGAEVEAEAKPKSNEKKKDPA